MSARARAAARRAAALGLARRLELDQAQLAADVAHLSAIGSRPDGFRVTGTPEDRAAAAHAASRMEAIGLTGVAVEDVRVDGWRLEAASLALTGGRTLHGASLGGAPGTPPGGITAPLVDVGRAGRARLDRLDVAGRVALLDWHTLAVAPADVALELGLRGAVGIVLASFPGGPLYQAEGAVGSFDSHWHAGAPPVLTVAKEDALELRGLLRQGPVEGTLVVEATLAPGTAGANVVGYLEGEADGPPIVVGAHHDGWFHAAFDNATGVAALLALAEGLVRDGGRPRHTICFTSRTAEEHGAFDSAYDWCAGAWGQVHDTHPDWAGSPFHLCLEASGHPGLRTIVEAPVELRGWAGSACRTADAEGWLTAGWRVGPPVSGTEQWPYLVSGVPGVATYAWETSFRRDRYHTPLDTPALVDLPHLERVIRTYSLLLAEADADPDAIHDHAARGRHLARAASAVGAPADALAAAARDRGTSRGRAAFTCAGLALHALDAHGALAYPHAQAAADLAALEAALDAVDAEDPAAAVAALERVGASRQARELSHEAFRRHLARTGPGAPRLAWGAASHLTASPDLWVELAALRGEPGAQAPGPWITASLRRHRDTARHDRDDRLAAMTSALHADRPEHP